MTLKTFNLLVILGLLTYGGIEFYKYSNKPNQTVVDPRLEKYLDEWKDACEKRSIDYTDALNRIEEIKFVNDLGGYDGLSRRGTRQVLINIKSAGGDPVLTRVILWHELGHYVFDLEHSEGIMNSTLLKSEIYEKNWVGYEAQYFNTIYNKLIVERTYKKFGLGKNHIIL